MPSKPTGRPRGRPKTKEYVTLMARVPSDLAMVVKRYSALHRQSISELIRDGLVWRIEQDTPGRLLRAIAPPDQDDIPPMLDNGDTGIHELSPMLHAAIQAAVRETLDHVQSRPLPTVLPVPHGEHGESVIQQPIPVLQKETGESPAASTEGYDASRFYLGKLCPKGHRYGDSGLSLLRKHNNGCRECEKAQKRERRARHKATQTQEGEAHG